MNNEARKDYEVTLTGTFTVVVRGCENETEAMDIAYDERPHRMNVLDTEVIELTTAQDLEASIRHADKTVG